MRPDGDHGGLSRARGPALRRASRVRSMPKPHPPPGREARRHRQEDRPPPRHAFITAALWPCPGSRPCPFISSCARPGRLGANRARWSVRTPCERAIQPARSSPPRTIGDADVFSFAAMPGRRFGRSHFCRRDCRSPRAGLDLVMQRHRPLRRRSRLAAQRSCRGPASSLHMILPSRRRGSVSA